MKKNLILLFLAFSSFLYSQNPVLVGYWHNWNDSSAPYIQLNSVDSRYTVICVSFAVPTSPSNMTMNFTPDGVSQSTFISQIQSLQNQGKKVLLSIGGATTSVSLNNTTNRDLFINSMNSLITTYGFDGIDIDIEHGNSIMASGTITNPTAVDCTNLIYAINQIKNNFYTTFSHNMILSFAPETAYVQGGMSAYGGIWGGYLPLLHALRNDINYVHVQLYNSGSVYGIDGNIYNQGTADFIIALSEALIQGFTTSGGFFQGFPANKVVVGLPACPSAAGGGFTTTTNVENAIKYLRGQGPKPGTYTLSQVGGYPNLGGMMTWSINWDKVTTCNTTSYAYAQNYELLFGSPLNIDNQSFEAKSMKIAPNPCQNIVRISNIETVESYSIIDVLGQIVQKGFLSKNESITVENLELGIYFMKIKNNTIKFIKN